MFIYIYIYKYIVCARTCVYLVVFLSLCEVLFNLILSVCLRTRARRPLYIICNNYTARPLSGCSMLM